MENNSVIAKFLGWQYNEENDTYFTPYSIYVVDDENGEESVHDNELTTEMMMFNTSWDWLMPVIKKIRGVINEELDFSDYDDVRYIVHNLSPYDYDIDHVYEHCVEFIKSIIHWYDEIAYCSVCNEKLMHDDGAYEDIVSGEILCTKHSEWSDKHNGYIKV